MASLLNVSLCGDDYLPSNVDTKIVPFLSLLVEIIL